MDEEVSFQLKKKTLYIIVGALILVGSIAAVALGGYHRRLATQTTTFSVLDATSHAPVVGAEVTAWQSLLGTKTAMSTADGLVTVSGLFPWRVAITIKKLGYKEETRSGRGGSKLDDVSLTRLPAATLKGKVANYVSDQPLEGVTVVAGESSTISGKDGSFTLTGLFIDTYFLSLQKDGFNETKPKVTINATAFDAGKITITPTGALIFATNREGGKRAVYTANFDGSDQKPLVSREGDTEDFDPIVSPHKKKVVFSSTRAGKKDANNQPLSQLYIVNIDGAGLRRLTEDEAFSSVRWSPDGSYLLYVGREKQTDSYTQDRLVVIDIVKNKINRVSDSQAYVYDIAPDDQRIAFAQENTDPLISGPQQLLVARPDGTEKQRIYAGEEGTVAGLLFMDARRLQYFYYTYSGGAAIQKRREYDVINQTTQVIQPPAQERSGTRSPDGQHIAYVDERDGKRDVFLSDLNGKNEKQLTTLGLASGGVEWDLTGKYILFGLRKEAENARYIVGVDGGTPKKVVDTVESYYYYDFGGGGGGG